MEGLEATELKLSEVMLDNDKLRIDSLYFSRVAMEAERRVEKLPCGYTTFAEAASTFRKGIFDIKAEKYTEAGIPFVRISNLRNGLINDADIAYIPPEIHADEEKTALKYGDIILSKTAYAAASFVNLPECNVSQDTIAVKIKPEWSNKLKSPYVVAFLNSKIGNRLLIRQFQGNVQMHLSLPDGEKVKIPLLGELVQNAVENAFVSSFQGMKQAEATYAQAETLLLRELGLEGWQPPEPLAYQSTFREAWGDGRLDAEHFQPKYIAMLERVKQFAPRWRPVGEFAAFCDRGAQPLYNENGLLAVVNSRHILENGLDYDNFERTDADLWDDPNFFSSRLNRGDILTYTTGAKIGRTASYLSEERALGSNHVNILRLKAENSIYVGVVLNSLIGRMQTRGQCTGSAQVEIYPSDIKKFIVPFVADEVQQQIVKAVETARHARRRAKQLLETAKRAVEVAIEDSEEAALALLTAPSGEASYTEAHGRANAKGAEA